jgi:hypothetical protein
MNPRLMWYVPVGRSSGAYGYFTAGGSVYWNNGEENGELTDLVLSIVNHT